jgi:UDP-3-O-[3-hydroxymyristoyl] glucosamine N-acyltransferase
MTDAVIGARLPTGPVVLEPGAFVAESARLAVPKETTIRAYLLTMWATPAEVSVGARSIVLDDVVVQEGTTIGRDCFIDRAVHIGFDCWLADSCRVEYRAQICDRVRIGAGSVIGGFVCDGATIGDECVVIGELVHGVREPDLPWGQYEPNPRLADRVFVGRGAVVVGGVMVGAGAYVAANATVTKDVPADHVAINTNEFVPVDEWKGRLDRKRWGDASV